jgi:hypothetical protein
VFYFSSSFYETEKGVYAAVQSAAIDVHDAPGPGGGMVAAIRRRKWLEPRRNTRHQLLKKMAGATAEHPPSIAKKMAGTTAEHPPSIAKKNGWSLRD